MNILNEKDVQDIRHGGFSEKIFAKVLKDNPELQKIEKYLSKKYHLHLGESVILRKAYIVNKKRNLLPDHILECKPWESFFCFIAGYNPDTKKIVIGRWFRDMKGPKHFDIPNVNFLRKIYDER